MKIKKFWDIIKVDISKVTNNNIKDKRNKEEEYQETEQTKKKERDIDIQIECDDMLFCNEDEIIFDGAEELIRYGTVQTMEEAIIRYATMYRGLDYVDITKSEDGKTKIVFRETIHDSNENHVYDEQLDER